MLVVISLSRISRSLHRRGQKVAKELRSRVPRRPRPAILMYHRIADDSFDPWGTVASPGNFADQLSWLSGNRTLLPLPRFAELHRSGSLPADSLAITFDDGYRCNAEVAAPLLEQFRIPATMFLPVEWIEKGATYWWDELEEIVLGHDGDSLHVGGREIALGQRQSGDRRWTFGSGPRTPRQSAFDRICRDLSTSSPKDVESAMGELRRQAGTRTPSAPAKRPMTPEQVRAVASVLIGFGSHALRHPWLPSLAPDEQALEIGSSVDRCEALSGARPVAFAYPFGATDESSRRLVEEAGFNCACSTEDGGVAPSSSVFSLPRVHVGNWTAAGLKRALASL